MAPGDLQEVLARARGAGPCRRRRRATCWSGSARRRRGRLPDQPGPGHRRDRRLLPARRRRRVDVGRGGRGQRHVRRLRDGRRGAVRARGGRLPARVATRRSSPRSSAAAPRRWPRRAASSPAATPWSTTSPSTASASPVACIPTACCIKGGLRAGDRLFLSKPLGTGVITTAAKNGAAPDEALAAAVASMLRLNRVAARVAARGGRHRRHRHHGLRLPRPRRRDDRWPPARASRSTPRGCRCCRTRGPSPRPASSAAA